MGVGNEQRARGSQGRRGADCGDLASGSIVRWAGLGAGAGAGARARGSHVYIVQYLSCQN
jgi:hypothetical protein